MRYADSGGLDDAGRAKHEAVRLQAAELFNRGVSTPAVARELRASRQAVAGWRRAWKAGGTKALVSKGPGGAKCRLDEQQLAELKAELKQGRLSSAAIHHRVHRLLSNLLSPCCRPPHSDQGRRPLAAPAGSATAS